MIGLIEMLETGAFAESVRLREYGPGIYDRLGGDCASLLRQAADGLDALTPTMPLDAGIIRPLRVIIDRAREASRRGALDSSHARHAEDLSDLCDVVLKAKREMLEHLQSMTARLLSEAA